MKATKTIGNCNSPIIGDEPCFFLSQLCSSSPMTEKKIAVIEELLSNQCCDIDQNRNQKDKPSPLRLAIQLKSLKLVNLLIEYGAKVDQAELTFSQIMCGTDSEIFKVLKLSIMNKNLKATYAGKTCVKRTKI